MSFEKRFISHRGITVIQKRDPSVRPLRPGKVAIVLAGGAVSGGAYKAGGLQALDEIFARRKLEGGRTQPFGLCDFDLFVGLSAGSVLASVLSAGITPEEVVRIILGQSDLYEVFQPWHFMWPNVAEIPYRIRSFFGKQNEVLTNWLSGATSELTGNPFTLAQTLVKMAAVVGRLAPTGLFTPERIEEYLRRNMDATGIPNDFAELHRRSGKSLYLAATDLNRGRLVVFGHDEPFENTPVSTAVAASCALPVWYRPVRVPNPLAGQLGEPETLDLADGGLMRTANVRIAIEKGAQLVICYNPFTRIIYDRLGRSLYEHGMYAIVQQAARTLIGARLDLAKELVFSSDDFDADVVFIEPAADDYSFFNMNPLSFWTKERAALHGYQSVRDSLHANHGLLADVFRTHGIELQTPSREAPGPQEAQPVDVRESRGSAS
jgi:predicted acylesterase/phospholipase RssA